MGHLATPILLMILASAALGVGMLVAGTLLGPSKPGAVKEMPYESGMDPVHDARRRFDVRFHLVAIAFVIFDVELLFLYPWAVANRHVEGLDAAVADGVTHRGVVFWGVMFFLLLVVLGLVYEWLRGVLRWR
ncbi:MAG: NADH-quinone oxidoreductase subunit J [Planctomycetaceae bacterium]|nr:NADH-quinone oxidoreductase subunit J [Planctomycetaceae bacterium]MBP60362.1 NADH-quinone oxidoreductase subunit J [Planctomycetaceae bacterium]